jgi:signal transduction histidine kinase
VSVRFSVPRGKLSDKTVHALLRSIRELVVNALRHGGATDIKVAGALEGEHLICSVTDNGSGFDPASAPGVLQGHFGLQGIRERIDALGGEFTIESTPDKGTKARMKI